MKKLKYLLFIVISFAFITNVNAKNDPLKITEVDGVESVINGSAVSDSKYSFSFHANNNTTLDVSGVNSSNFVFFDSNNTYFKALPKVDSSKKEFSVNVNNVGYYNGKAIDLKLTYKWKNIEFEFNSENKTVVPAIGLTIDKTNGKLVHLFYSGSYEVYYEILQDGKPLDVNMSLFIEDVDGGQYYGLKTNSGNINNIQVSKDSALYAHKANNYFWFYDQNNVLVDEDPNKVNTIRFELADTNSFNLIIGCEEDAVSYSDYVNAPRHTLNPDNIDTVNQNLLERYERIYNADTRNEVQYGGVTTTSDSYGPYKIPTPFKFVKTTSSGIFLESASLNDDTEEITYNLSSFVPRLYNDYNYLSYEIIDEISKDLSIVSINVLDENGEKVNDKFNVTSDNNVVKVKAKDETLSSSSFYDKTYFVNIVTNLTDTAKKDMETSGTIVIENDFSLNVLEKGKSEVTTLKSNKTYTSLGAYKIETEVLNGTIDPAINAVFAGKDVTINFKANEGYKLIAIYIDDQKQEITGDEESYTFKNVDNSHRIKVVYEIENPDLGAFVSWTALFIGGAGALLLIHHQKKKNVLFRL